MRENHVVLFEVNFLQIRIMSEIDTAAVRGIVKQVLTIATHLPFVYDLILPTYSRVLLNIGNLIVCGFLCIH